MEQCPLRIEIFFSRSRKMKILTAGIHVVFRGLKSESDAEIGKNSQLLMDTAYMFSNTSIPNKFRPFFSTMAVALISASLAVTSFSVSARST